MLTNLSYSSVYAYLQCPRRFEYTYLRKLPGMAGGSMIQGIAFHKAIEFALGEKLRTAELPSLSDTTEVYRHNFYQSVSGCGIIPRLKNISGIDWEDIPVDTWAKQGEDLVILYYQQQLPKLEPYSIEPRLTVISNGIKVVGYPDIVLSSGRIIDLKITSKTWTQEQADRDLQPGFYALLCQHPIDFEFHLAVTTKTPKVIPILTKRDEKAIERIKTLVSDVWALMQVGTFPINPSGWVCSPKYCAHTDLCRDEVTRMFSPWLGEDIEPDDLPW